MIKLLLVEIPFVDFVFVVEIDLSLALTNAAIPKPNVISTMIEIAANAINKMFWRFILLICAVTCSTMP